MEVYDNLYCMFNPVKFDPDQWVQLPKDSGMKYLVFTSKHHDGLCEFDTKLTEYKITSEKSPYRKDIVRQISDACPRAGLAWGVYYSQPDWHHPDYRNGKSHARYIEYFRGQVRELRDNIIYLHVLRWPSDTISLPPLPRRIVPDSLLGGGKATVKQERKRHPSPGHPP